MDLLGRAGSALAGREAFEAYHARLAAAAVELSDLARTLRDEVEGWEDDPQRLVDVQERRRLLAELRRKYGEDLAPSWPTAARAPARLAALENAEAEAARLQAERDGPPGRAGRGRGGRARPCAPRPPVPSARQVGERLGALAMAGARLEVRVAPDGAGEPVELALGANVGEAVQPLARAASGGELARAMLAIRLVGLGGPQTMVFDEVDAGVGGAAALALGEALHEVGRRPPGAGRHPPGPGGAAGRRADQRGQGPVAGPHGDHGHRGARARSGSPSCPGCSRGTPTATPPGPTPASCSGASHGR